MLHIASREFFTVIPILFLLATVLPVTESAATELIPVYRDARGEGFYDETPMTDNVARGGTRGSTLGEVRRNAFQNALDILEGLIRTNNSRGIRVQASFEDMGGENVGGGITIAGARPAAGLYISGLYESPLLPGGEFLAVPIALAEHMLERELNRNEADVEITFNERVRFYYGREFGEPPRHVNFTIITAHELLHGLGFSDLIKKDGSFPEAEVEDVGSGLAIGLYDLNLYSENEEKLLINLSQSERQEAITSGDGLLWDGTLGGRFPPSCARLMGEALIDEYPQAVDSEGRPRLYAPEPYETGSSVGHLAEASLDLMKPTYDGAEHLRFTLGMLLDILWTVGGIDRDNQEILEDCLADSGEGPEPEPEPEPEPTAGSGGGGGGCTIAESQNTQQNAMFNLFLILCTLFPVLFYTNSMSSSQVFKALAKDRNVSAE